MREDIKRLHARIDSLEDTIGILLDAQTGGAESKLLRGELRKAFGRIRELEEENRRQREEMEGMRRKIAYYESENMPTSTPSGYNGARDKFRRRRGEDPKGGPGEKISREDGGDEDDVTRGPSGGRIGPPVGHAGASHHNRATLPPLYYPVDDAVSECCKRPLAGMRPACKLVYDLDACYAVQCAMAVIGRAGCPSCGRVFRAPSPFLDGTSLGPVLLSVILMMFAAANTDEGIADMIRGIFGFELSPNAVRNGRSAVSTHIQSGMLARIMRMIQLRPHIQMDESRYGRGDGHHGYVWVAYTPAAVFVLFSPTRSASVLSVHFAWLRGKPVTCDGYAGYPELTGTIQRDFVHILRKAERVAVVGKKPEDEARYDMLLGLYRDAKRIKTLAPLTMMELSRRAYAIAASYEDPGFRTHLLNAIPNLFTFQAHPGMSPHSNDVEREIRDGLIPQRNVRRKTMTAGGRLLMSVLLTFTRTCHRQNVSPGRALLEYLLDRDWSLFERAGDTPYSLTNPDGTRYSVFGGPGPPRDRAAVAA